MAAISVLLVEDEALISMLVSDALSEEGFEVHEVATADDALDFIEAGGRVDVLFTDILIYRSERQYRRPTAGISISMVDGSVLQNILVSNVVIRDAATLDQIWPAARPYGFRPWVNNDLLRTGVVREDVFDSER